MRTNLRIQDLTDKQTVSSWWQARLSVNRSAPVVLTFMHPQFSLWLQFVKNLINHFQCKFACNTFESFVTCDPVVSIAFYMGQLVIRTMAVPFSFHFILPFLFDVDSVSLHMFTKSFHENIFSVDPDL